MGESMEKYRYMITYYLEHPSYPEGCGPFVYGFSPICFVPLDIREAHPLARDKLKYVEVTKMNW